MEDRNVQFPQRYQLKKVEGTEDIYDLIPAPGEISSPGTLINKATLWKDATAALFGLGVNSVPDDGFAYLGKYAQHWWRRRTSAKKIYSATEKTPSSTLSIASASYSTSVTVTYDSTYNISQENGAISFPNPKSTTILESTASSAANQFNSIVGTNYFKSGPFFARLIKTISASDLTEDRGLWELATSAFVLISTEITDVPAGDWEYVQSSDRSAYPDSGEQDGYEYEYLGIPFDNAVGAPGIETGSYIGTGTYGSENPTSISFSFNPRIVIIRANNPANSGISDSFVSGELFSTSDIGWIWSPGNTSTQVEITWGANKIEIVGSAGWVQFNRLGAVYDYIALG